MKPSKPISPESSKAIRSLRRLVYACNQRDSMLCGHNEEYLRFAIEEYADAMRAAEKVLNSTDTQRGPGVEAGANEQFDAMGEHRSFDDVHRRKR